MNDVQVGQIEALMRKSELDSRSQELLRQFFNSISDQPQFPKILNLLGRFPNLFENFCKCFQLKRDFIKQGKTEAEWNEFLSKEETVFDRMDGK